MDWVNVSDSVPLESGVTYRTVYQIRAPYNDAVTGTIRNAIMVGNTINNIDAVGGLHSTVDITNISTVPPAVSSHDPTEKLPWTLIIEYVPHETVVSEADVSDVIGFLGPILLALAFLIAVVGHYSQKLTAAAVATAHEVTQDLKSTVLNPGVLLAGFVVLVLFLRR